MPCRGHTPDRQGNATGHHPGDRHLRASAPARRPRAIRAASWCSGQSSA